MNSPPSEIQISVLKTIEGEEELREQWNNLVLQTEAPQVFFTYEWALAVERAFKSTIQPWIFAFAKHGKLIGVAALACDMSDSKKFFFLGASTGDYCDVISTPGDREDVVTALLREFQKLKIRGAFFASVPEDSITLQALAQSHSAGYWNTSQPAYTCRRIVFDRKSTNPIGSSVSEHRLNSEKLRRLSKLGKISFEHLQATDEIAPVLDPMIKAQIARFLSTNRLSPLLRPERRNFLAELTSLLGPRHWMDLSVLRLNGRDIAWNFGFRFEEVLFWYLPGFDTALESHRPGGGLLNLLNEEGEQAANLKEIDLGLGDESYKVHLANAQRKTLNVHLGANFFSHSKTLVRNEMVKRIKSFPAVEQFARSLLGATSQVIKSSKLSLLQRIFRKIFSSDETIFFESAGDGGRKNSSYETEALHWNNLAVLALQNSEDPEMLEYLRQTAPRIRLAKKKSVHGFVVQGYDSKNAQYYWVDEIPMLADEHPQPAAMIFDHWAPASIRGKQLQKAAIECVAEEIKKQGKTPWFSVNHAEQNVLHALQNSSFNPRYAIIHRKFIFSMPAERKQVHHPQARP
jgi:CelD/BcsL family acetyltransferase involved in cellulose biosynthesis